MLDQALKIAQAQVEKGKTSICLYLEDGHAGVHGIAASRIKDTFGRPVIFFSPKLNETEIITASARSIEAINLKELLDQIQQINPDLLLKYGGHKMAAGLTIKKADLEVFEALFESLVKAQVDHHVLGPEIYTDGVISDDSLTLETIELINQIEPFGREFDVPVFTLKGQLVSHRFVGQTLEHLQLLVRSNSGKEYKAIWFFASRYPQSFKFEKNDNLEVIFRLNEEEFNNRRSLGLIVEYCDYA